MKCFVIDASVAIKWVFGEEGSDEAIRLQVDARLIAPELLLAECANIIWKKVRRGEYTPVQGAAAGTMIERAEIALFPTAGLFRPATRMAIQLDHPAYDCFYLALAEAEACPLVTADLRLLARTRASSLDLNVLSLAEAAAL